MSFSLSLSFERITDILGWDFSDTCTYHCPKYPLFTSLGLHFPYYLKKMNVLLISYFFLHIDSYLRKSFIKVAQHAHVVSDWKFLARELGVNEGDLTEIETDYDSMRDRCFQVRGKENKKQNKTKNYQTKKNWSLIFAVELKFTLSDDASASIGDTEHIMTSWYTRHDIRVTALVWGESIRNMWIPLTNSNAVLWCFLWC